MNLAEKAFYERIAAEEQARLARYKTGWQYYGGEQKRALKVKPNQPDDNLVVNLWEYIVDKGVSFLFGREVTWQIDEQAETREEELLAAIWAANRKMTLLQDVALNGAICGHIFVKIVPQAGQPTRLVNLDPAIVRPVWNPEDLSDVLWYKIEFEAMDENAKQVFHKQILRAVKDGTGETVRWTMENYLRRSAARDYTPVGAPQDWPYPFAPVVDWKNLPAPNAYFGKPDIESTDLQDGVNFVGSNTQRILRYHAHPKTVGSGFSADNVKIGPDDMVILPSPDAKAYNLEMQSDLGSSLAFFNTLRGLHLRLKRVPDLDPEKVNVGALSGFALRILYGDLLELTETKRRLYGDGIVELNRRLLIVNGIAQPRPLKLHWGDPLPASKKETVDELDVEVNKLGTVSKQTAAEELGRDWEKTEKLRLEGEALSNSSIGSQLLQAFQRGGGGGTP